MNVRAFGGSGIVFSFVLWYMTCDAGKDVEEAIVTTADMLRAEGRNKGVSEGRSEAQREMLLKLLSQRFGALPEQAATRVSAAGPAELEAWFDRALTAPTLADVLGEG